MGDSKTLGPTLLRYWTTGPLDPLAIRIEWQEHGILHTTCGRLHRNEFMRWDYDRPPCDVAELAVVCLRADGEYTVHGVTYEGTESMRQMDEAVCRLMSAEAA